MKNKSRNTIISIDEIKEDEIVNEPHKDLELTKLVFKLTEKYSTVIYLFYFEEMKISEIATSLGISQSAVKLRLSRGRDKLKNLIEKENKNGLYF